MQDGNDGATRQCTTHEHANTTGNPWPPWVNTVKKPYYRLGIDNLNSLMFGPTNPIRNNFTHINPSTQQFINPSMQQFNRGEAM